VGYEKMGGTRWLGLTFAFLFFTEVFGPF